MMMKQAHETNCFHTTNLQKDAQINHIYKVIHMCSSIVNTCNEIKSKLLIFPCVQDLKQIKPVCHLNKPLEEFLCHLLT